MLITLLSLFWLSLASHDIQVATFKIYEENSKVLLQVYMEAEDVAQTLDLNIDTITTEVLKKYLEQHTRFFFNQVPQKYDINQVDLDHKHLTITAQFSSPPEDLNHIELHNSCLLEIEDQSNVIELRLNNQEKDFLMNKFRTVIHIQL